MWIEDESKYIRDNNVYKSTYQTSFDCGDGMTTYVCLRGDTSCLLSADLEQ